MSKNDWESAIRLCRLVKERNLWGCLAAMALSRSHLPTAEVALAAIDEVDKLQYVVYIQGIPLVERQTAELACLQRRFDEAEAILLQAGLPFRAIEMHMRMLHWERALDLAVAKKTHIDTVLAYRERFLVRRGLKETNPKFLEFSQSVPVEWEKVKAKIAAEKEREKERSGGGGEAKS